MELIPTILNTEQHAVHLSLEMLLKFRVAVPLGEVCSRTLIGFLKRASPSLTISCYFVY
jgi:hypothetical protein